MHTRLLLLFVLLAQVVYGQTITEIRSTSLVDGDYALEGDVFLERYDDGSLDLRFDSDYMTQSNVFDVHVFLTNETEYTSPIDTTGMLLVANIGTVSGLNYSSGPMTFNLPSGVDINDYDRIVFICVQFGQLHWGHGMFSDVITVGSPELQEIGGPSVNLYPNPSESGRVALKFPNPQERVLLEVLNLNGQVIFTEQVVGAQSHLIELEEAGVYLLKLTSDDSSTVQKVIRL